MLSYSIHNLISIKLHITSLFSKYLLRHKFNSVGHAINTTTSEFNHCPKIGSQSCLLEKPLPHWTVILTPYIRHQHRSWVKLPESPAKDKKPIEDIRDVIHSLHSTKRLCKRTCAVRQSVHGLISNAFAFELLVAVSSASDGTKVFQVIN